MRNCITALGTSNLQLALQQLTQQQLTSNDRRHVQHVRELSEEEVLWAGAEMVAHRLLHNLGPALAVQQNR
jgi:hypothetical protein